MGLFGIPDVNKLKVQKNVKGLIKALKAKNAEIRIKAAEALGEIGLASAVESLIASVLKDENKNMRWKSAEALREMGWEPKNEAERIVQLVAMRRLKVEKNVKGLIKALKDKNSAVESLAASLEDENKNMRWKSAEALRKMGWEPKNEAERIALLVATRRWDELTKVQESSISALIAALKYVKGGYFLYPLAALWEIGRLAVPPLVDAVRDRDSSVPSRQSAGVALGVIGDTQAIEPLVAILRDRKEDKNLRGSIGLALRCMGEAVLEPMVACLRDKDADVVVSASAATNLGHIGEPAIEGLVDALRDEDLSVRAYALMGLIATGCPKAIQAVRSMMREEKDSGVLRDLPQFLDRFDPPSLERLASTIKHSEGRSRKLAAQALGHTGDCSAVESLTHAFRYDSNASVRDSASWSLGILINCPGVRDTLLEMLGVDDLEIRLAAAVVLKVSGVPVLWSL